MKSYLKRFIGNGNAWVGDGRVRGWKVECHCCDEIKIFTSQHGKNLPPPVLFRKFTEAGWQLSKLGDVDLCPKCVDHHKKARLSARVTPPPARVTPPPEPPQPQSQSQPTLEEAWAHASNDERSKFIERCFSAIRCVLEPGLTPLDWGQLLNEKEYLEAQALYGADNFTAFTINGSLDELLRHEKLDPTIDYLVSTLFAETETTTPAQAAAEISLTVEELSALGRWVAAVALAMPTQAPIPENQFPMREVEMDDAMASACLDAVESAIADQKVRTQPTPSPIAPDQEPADEEPSYQRKWIDRVKAKVFGKEEEPESAPPVKSDAQRIKTDLDQAKLDLVNAQRSGEYLRAGELAFGSIPQLEQKLISAERSRLSPYEAARRVISGTSKAKDLVDLKLTSAVISKAVAILRFAPELEGKVGLDRAYGIARERKKQVAA